MAIERTMPTHYPLICDNCGAREMADTSTIIPGWAYMFRKHAKTSQTDALSLCPDCFEISLTLLTGLKKETR